MHKDDDLWLRKIAAFLHDPPYKVWALENIPNHSRDKDVVDLFKIIEPNEQFPFPLDPKRPYRISKAKRYFHKIAGSSMKNSIFGFERKIPPNLEPKFVRDGKFIVHTVSGTGIKIDELKVDIPSSPEQDFIKVLQFIASKPHLDAYKKFLELWRMLNIYLKDGKTMLLMPIDTRLPDQIYLDFAATQSALASTVDPQKDFAVLSSFLILEFRPVQKFIANARKTRDLWFSSWLISYLAWKAMKPIAEGLGPDNIVYPDLYKQPLVDDWLKGLGIQILEDPKMDMPTLPNTFLAIVSEGKEKEFAEKSQRALKDAWDEIVNGVYDLLTEAGIMERGSPLEKEFKRQTEQLPFDIYWLGLKWGNKPEEAIDDYKRLLDPRNNWEFGKLWEKIREKIRNPNIGDTYALLVEMAQTGLKALKYRGKPVFTEEKWQKCSLCGERSALVDLDLEKLENDSDYVDEMIKKFGYRFKEELDEKGRRNGLYYKQLKDFWKKIAEIFPGHIKENEHLCAVCLVKRLAPKVVFKYPERFFDSTTSKLDYHFPSTSSVALASFVKELLKLKEDNPEIENAIRELEKSLLDLPGNFRDAHFTEGRTVPRLGRILDENKFLGDFEPEWFYDESFPRFYDELEHQRRIGVLKEVEYKEKRNWAEKIENAVEQIRKVAKNELKDNYHLPKYYAAVYLDGDDLGKWLRGEKAPKIEDVFHPEFKDAISGSDWDEIKGQKRPVTPAIHRAISSALRDFALEVVPYVVEHHLGVVVYSGGDDTLFLMPLENLFQTLIALRKLYSGERFVGEFGGRRFESDKGFIKIYENDKLVEIIRVMGTKATLSAGVAIAHYLDPLDITLANAKEMLEKAKKKGRDRAGFRVIFHSGSERETVVQWRFVEMMERFKDAIAKENFSSRFLRILYRDIHVFNKLEDAFDAEFYKFGTRGQPDKNSANVLLCSLIEARKELKISPDTFLDALLISEFIVRGEGKK